MAGSKREKVKAVPLSKVEAAGGKILLPKTAIGGNGFMAHFVDTEGNKMAFHSPKQSFQPTRGLHEYRQIHLLEKNTGLLQELRSKTLTFVKEGKQLIQN